MKKSIARLILQGISILGILAGGMLVIAGLGVLLEMQREDLAVLVSSLVASAAMLVMGVYLIYRSYLMWRLGASTVLVQAILRAIPVLWAACVVFGVAKPVISFADTLACEGLSRHVKLSGALVSLVLFYLGVPVCTKLAKRLLKAAGIDPEEISGKDKDKHEKT
jgi:hypothetical protein